MSNLPQEVLDSLFKIPKSSEHEPSTMSWRNVVKKMQLLGPPIDFCPSTDAEPQQDIYGIRLLIFSGFACYCMYEFVGTVTSGFEMGL